MEKQKEWTSVDFTDDQLDTMIKKFSEAPVGSDEYWIFQLLMEKRNGNGNGSSELSET